MIKKVAILVNGGDCSGLNPVIRGIMKTAKEKNIECYGFIDGFRGIIIQLLMACCQKEDQLLDHLQIRLFLIIK